MQLFKFLVFTIFNLFSLACFSQTWEESFDETVRLCNEGKYTEAVLVSESTLLKIQQDIGTQNEDYCFCLSWKGYALRQLGRREEAVIPYTEATILAEKLFNKESSHYGTLVNGLGVIYFELEEYEKALPLLILGTDNLLLNSGNENSDFLYFHSRLAISYENLNQAENALELYKTNLQIAQKIYGEKNSFYAEHLYNLASLYKSKDQTDLAIPLYQDLLEISKIDSTLNSLDNATFHSDLGLIYNRLKQYDKALPLCLIGFELIKPYYSSDHWFYNQRERNLAVAYQNVGLLSEALPLYQEVVENSKKIYGERDLNYAEDLFDLATLYIGLKQFDDAVPIISESIDIMQDSLGKEDETYQYFFKYAENEYNKAARYTDLMNLYVSCVEYEKALNFLIQLMVVNYEAGKDPLNLLNVYLPAMNLWLMSSDYHFSEFPMYKDRFFLLLMDATKESELIEDHETFCEELMGIAGQYMALGDFNEALLLYERMEEIAVKNTPKDENLIMSLNLAKANIYGSLGQPDRATPFLKEALENQGKSGWMEEMEYSRRLMSLGNNARSRNQFKEGFSYDMEAYILIKPHFERNEESTGNIRFVYTEYPEVLGNLSSYYANEEKLDSALFYINEAINYSEKNFPNSEQLYLLYNNLAAINSQLNDYINAEKYYLKALKGYQEFYGDQSEYTAIIQGNLCFIYQKMGKIDLAFQLANEINENIQTQIQKNFAFLSEQQKVAYTSEYNSTFEYFKGLALIYRESEPSASSLAYNIELATKGLILNAGIEMREVIANLQDSSANAVYLEWVNLNSQLAKAYSLPISERKLDVLAMEERAEELENNLSRISNKNAGFVAVKSPTWQAIQSNLKSDEIAIEFATSKNYNGSEWLDDIQYMAIIIDKKSSSPKIVPLFLQSELDKILTKGSSSDERFVDRVYRGDSSSSAVMSFKSYTKIYDLIWKPMESFIPTGSTIYYAPAGSLHQLAFAAIPKGDSLLLDFYNLVQLNTTAILVHDVLSKNKSLPKNIALYGGINYKLTVADLEQEKIKREVSLEESARSIPDDMERGGEWSALPGTLKEIQQIEMLANNRGIKTIVYSELKATEESLKDIKRNSPEVLHISTHGFFFPDPEKQPLESGLLVPQNEFKLSDDPMNRSGILLAGANNTWKRDKILDGFEDGILTAKEASFLSLENTELVVLSACETGLGAVKGSEGVFGLQRAFKAAGVHYLIMSLWKVPDKETAEFMTKFYNTWFNGTSIREAFLLTQHFMQQKYFDQPYKWAAFVLLE